MAGLTLAYPGVIKGIKDQNQWWSYDTVDSVDYGNKSYRYAEKCIIIHNI